MEHVPVGYTLWYHCKAIVLMFIKIWVPCLVT